MAADENVRQYDRVDIVLKVDYSRRPDLLADLVSNASEGGVFVATDRSFEVGQSVELELSFPGLVEPMKCQGEVRWRRTPQEISPGQVAGIGVAFRFESDDQKKRFHRLIGELRSARISGGTHQTSLHRAAPFRVLLAEDNQVVRDMFRTALTKFHNVRYTKQSEFSLTEVDNGRDAWEHLEQESYDLAILDYYMPVLDGLEVVRRLRKSEGQHRLPVIIISAGGEDAQRSAYEAGADMFLGKPVLLNQLFESLHQLLLCCRTAQTGVRAQ